MYDAAADISLSHRNRKNDYKNEVHKLTLLLKLLRLVDRAARTHSTTSLDAFVKAHPLLPSDPADARVAINALLSEGGVEDKVHEAGATSLRKRNALDKIKIFIPSTRIRLHALRVSMTDDPSSDPNVMARIAATFWAKIWASRSRDADD
jgi:hypothetical protein